MGILRKWLKAGILLGLTGLALLSLTAWCAIQPVRLWTASRFDWRSPLTVEYGSRSRLIAATVDDKGLSIERNTYPFSGSEESVSFRAGNARRPFFGCGTGMDATRDTTTFQFAGVGLSRWTYYQSWATGTDAKEHERKAFSLHLPHWLLATTSGSYPLFAGVGWIVTRRRYAKGHCQTCGYDLRMTPDQCPECGTFAVLPSLKLLPRAVGLAASAVTR